MGNGSVVYSGDHHTLDFGFNGKKRFSEDLVGGMEKKND